MKLTDAESLNSEKIRRKEYTKRIVKAVNYKGNNDFEDVPSILYEYQEENLNIINRQKAEIERLQGKSIADDKLLNDRVQEAVNSVSKANQKYVDALEKAFNNKVAELKAAKVDAIKKLREKCNEHQDFHKGDDGVFKGWISMENLDRIIDEM